MYKRINGGIRGYLIDFDLAGLAGREPANLDRTGTMPFMALELLHSVVRKAPITHTYDHDAEAVCWVVLWLGVQYEDGERVTRSFREWEMVNAKTCYQEKRTVLEDLHLYAFTEANKVLQEPIRDILDKFDTLYFQKRKNRGKALDLDIGGWMDECDKEIRDQVSCTSE